MKNSLRFSPANFLKRLLHDFWNFIANNNTLIVTILAVMSTRQIIKENVCNMSYVLFDVLKTVL